MANLSIDILHGQSPSISSGKQKCMGLQMHITKACDQNCIHCYFKNSEYNGGELNSDEWCSLIDEYYSFLHCQGGKSGTIAITGGDPLLSDTFFKVLSHVHDNYPDFFIILVMGNPYHITEDNAIKMKQLGVYQYQISLDGLEKMHDCYRKKGSFKKSIEALAVLKKVGIKTVVAMTISKTNANEVIPLLEYLNKLDVVDIFGFDKMVPVGNGKNMKKDLFSPIEYRRILLDVLEWEVLNKPVFEISKKDYLWKLLFYELGLANPLKDDKRYAGCMAGVRTMGIMPNGVMMVCPMLKIPGTKYPENSLKSFIINNELAVDIVSRNKNKKCNMCEIVDYCGGCPAMKYATTGDIHGIELYCWK